MASVLKMAMLCRFRSFLRNVKNMKHSVEFQDFSTFHSFSTYADQPKSNVILKFSLLGTSIGVVLGSAYAFTKANDRRKKFAFGSTNIQIELLKYKPEVATSRKIISPSDTTGLELILFQYQTCPFCSKVRVLLDYYGLSYEVIEVDPVLKQEISWSSYKKVPILLVKVGTGYQPLNDSSMIISVLTTYLSSESQKIDNIAKKYPTITVNEQGTFKHEILNKYFLMDEKVTPKDRSLNALVAEQKWRKWTDDIFIHTISPNVYRSIREAYQTFIWFSKVGHWEEYFPLWERAIMINVGALSMWLISKNLRKKYNLKDDVRESFYDQINIWLNQIKAQGGIFMGGTNPDLADLAVYGVLTSIEGCEAFSDALKYTTLGTWYNAVKIKVESHAGSVKLNNQ